MAETSRASKELHPNREHEARADVWIQPSTLDAPPARPGYRQRWVATQILGKDVPHHAMRRQREGWTPRPIDTIPEDFPVPTIAHGQWENCIGIEGMILCELPEERGKLRDEYFAGKNREQNEFVDRQLDNVERGGGVKIERDQRSHVHKGTLIADDD